MRRTRIKMMAAVMAATMLLGGCGDALYDLTDDEENVIVNYAAHIVTKYNTYQREGLTYVSPEEPEETQEDVTVPQTPETQDASETGTAASAEDTASAVSVAAAGSASLDELFGADGIQMTYAGAQLAPGYMEGDYYEMTPDAGKQYLVLSIDVTNTGADGVGLDVLSVSPKFTVVLNQSVKSTAETTLLDTDFSTYQGTIPAGGSTRLVLVFQVPDDVASADSVELYVQMDQMIQIIL